MYLKLYFYIKTIYENLFSKTTTHLYLHVLYILLGIKKDIANGLHYGFKIF